ncbi:hypothetical protein Agub_g14567 [Astrephomene gubernaculifera]|uniref:Cilia- and flagella-associated protein 43 n=1 Tax=Astrephomene gubernaculifera TaxID=47775 RepID=A0AAD3E258_9CHLO|nr:hypothetical protein Agub_g14567 [Astrephomene gubernaculifera]
MAFQTRFAIGYNGSPVAWVGPDEVAWTCGNAVVLHSLSTRAQRVLKGNGFGISCFAINKRHNLIAIAEKGLKPGIFIYSSKNLQLLGRLAPDEPEGPPGLPGPTDKQQQPAVVVLGVTAMAFSSDGERLAVCGDEPDCSIIVYSWRKQEALGRARLPASQPASQVSFHPLDGTILATTGGGATSVWYLEPLWDRVVFRSQPTAPGCLPPGHQATVHAWAPAGLYVGTSGGALLLIDLTTMAPVLMSGGQPGDNSGSGGAGVGTSSQLGSMMLGMGMQQQQQQQQVVPAVVTDTVGPGAGVAALALNRDHVAVAGTDGSVHVFSQGPVAAGAGPPVFSHEVWLARGGSKGVPVTTAECGGDEYGTLLLGCPDGTVYRAAIAPHMGATVGARAGYTMATLTVDSPVGRLAGVVPHPGGGAFLTAGADGSVRLWNAADGQLLARRVISSAQCALAAAGPGAGLAAVGSETGVVRLLVLPPAPTVGDRSAPTSTSGVPTAAVPTQQLRVMYRRRLHTAAVDALAFSPDNDLLISAGRDGTVWLLAVDARSGTCRALGFVPLPHGERALSAVWPRNANVDVSEGESALLSLAGGGLMCITVSPELTSGNWRNPHADMALVRPPVPVAAGARALGSERESGDGAPSGAPEPVVVKLLRLEVPLLAVTSSPADRSGELYGLGADKHLHKLTPPVEAAAWAGLRARPHRSAVHVAAHARPGGGVAVAPAGHLLLTGGADGMIALRNIHLAALADSSGSGGGTGGGGGPLHDVTAGGVASVTFDAVGRYFASAGADGALFLFEVSGGAAAATHLVTPPWPAVPYSGNVSAGRDADGDDIDDPAEPTEVELRQRQAVLDSGGSGGESRRAAMAGRLASLRGRIAELLKANEAAPELERLDRSDLIVDLGLVERLKRDMEGRVAAVQAAVRRDNLRTDLLTERVRRMVWDSMATKGAVISALRAPTQVHNFPLTQPGSHERVLRQVALLRRVEMSEHAVLGVVPYNFMFRGTGLEGFGDNDDGYEGNPATGDGSMGQTAAAAAAAAAVAAAAAAAAAAANNSGGSGTDPDTLMYSDFDLHCSTRKAMQMHLIKQKIRDLKAAFNVDFNRVAAQKRADCDRIADLNARLDDTLKDLRKLGAAPPPGLLEERYQLGVQDTRDNIQAAVLTVRDEEVAAERYVSPEERARQDAARRAEEEAARRSARDNAGERALRQMMGGTLAPKGGGADGEGTPFTLPPPAWLVALGLDPESVNPKLVTEEQARELKEWQAREKALQEERSRRVGVLELELRTAKAAVEEVVGRFDEALAALAVRRHRVASEVAALEARVLALAASLARCTRVSEAVERSLLARLGAAKEAHGRASTELTDRRTALAELETRQAQAAAEERQLDRNLKKEFAEADVWFNRLQQLYRARRPEQVMGPGPSVGGVGGGAGGGGGAGPSTVSGGGGALSSYNSGGGGVEMSGSSFRVLPGTRPSGLGGQQQSGATDTGAGGGARAASGAGAVVGAGGGGAAATAAAANAPPPTYTHAPPSIPPMLTSGTLDPFPDVPAGLLIHHEGRPASALPAAAAGGGGGAVAAAGAVTTGGAVAHHAAAGGHAAHGHMPHVLHAHTAPGNVHGHGMHALANRASQTGAQTTPGVGVGGGQGGSGGGASAAAAAAAGPSQGLGAALDPSLKPEGLDQGLWERFVAYRAERLAAEAAVRAAAVDISLARRDLPELEGRESVLASEMDGLMSAITSLRTERRTSAYDNEIQLRLLAGQVEAAPPVPASADMSDARLLALSVVEALNSVVLGKGTKKVDILTAMKDFKRGIYAAQWEAAAADMQLDDLRAKIRDLQLLHVTRDMQTVLKDGEDRSSALEAASLEALMKQRERLHAKALEDKRRRLRRLAADVGSRSGQNQEVAVHLVTLGKVLEEQQRLQAGMQSSSEQAARRMRSLVTHKKLKEIAVAQQTELAELRGQAEKLRLRTYPTFVEMATVAGMPSLPRRLPPDIKLPNSAPASGSGGYGSIPSGPPLRL